MKLLLFTLLAIASITVRSQGAFPATYFLGSDYYFTGGEIVKSHYDTTVLYIGNTKFKDNNKTFCEHTFAAKRKIPSLTACDVIHGATGCPDIWYDNYEICTECLKHIHVKETRTAETIKDLYEETLEILRIRLSNK